jgi:hypothetical protein
MVFLRLWLEAYSPQVSLEDLLQGICGNNEIKLNDHWSRNTGTIRL